MDLRPMASRAGRNTARHPRLADRYLPVPFCQVLATARIVEYGQRPQ